MSVQLQIERNMQKFFLLAALVFLAKLCHSEKQCELNVAQSKQSKFIGIVKGWFGSLKNNVKDRKTSDCNDCDSIRPPGQKDVTSVKDNRTGCRCEIANNNDKFQCVCCFKLKKWDYLICNSAGFTLGSKEVFLVVTVEDQVIVEAHVSLEAWWAQLVAKLLSCIPLPPPVAFLSICFKPSLEKPAKSNNNTWVLCIQLKIGILLVPVISVKPKCFHIGGKSNGRLDLIPQWMKIEGQTDPKLDVSNPADSQVVDENFNGVVCLANFKKKQAGMCILAPTGPSCDPPTEEPTRKINWRQSEVGETPFLAVLHQERFPKQVNDVHGDDADYPFISKVLDRAGEEKWMDEDAKISLVQPGRTCGGALLTANKVLTICACVRSFYFLHKLHEDPGEDVMDHPFDIQSADIYVDFLGVTYNSAEVHHLEKDEKKFMSDSVCAKGMAKGDTWNLQTSFIVMRFAPEIKNPGSGQFAPWPPMKMEKGMEAELVGFGMEPVNQSWLFKTKSGEVLDFDRVSVDIFMTPCELTEYSKLELKKHDLGDGVSGFCSSESGFQLCYGKMGLPLTSGRKQRQLVGLSSLPIDCSHEGSTAGAIFTDEIIEEINKYLASAHLVRSWAWLNFILISFLRMT